jgi:hypothetical protein
MRTRLFLPPAIALLTALLTGLTGAADAQTRAASGLARLTGTVVAAGTGEPLAGADVRILETGVKTFTAPDGHFEFDALTSGRHTVIASRSGYVTAAAGMTGPKDRPRAVELTAGSPRHVQIQLVALGAITGRIVDAAGQPVGGIRVRAIRRRTAPSAYERGAEVGTDDDGRFAIRELDSGHYFVIADKRTPPRAAPRPAARFPPDPAAAPLPNREGDPMASLTYYPGTAFPDQAGNVEVVPGEESDATFTLAEPRLARITGVVLDPRGAPVSDYTLRFKTTRPPQPQDPLSIGITIDGERFELIGVPPGEYVIEATRQRPGTTSTPRVIQLNPVANAGEIIRKTLRVEGHDIAGVTLQLSTGFKVLGRVVDTSGNAVEIAGLPVSATLVDDDLHRLTAITNADGTFNFDRLSGRYRIHLEQQARTSLALERVHAGGIDASSEGLDVALDIFVEIVVAPATRLKGMVASRDGRPLAKAWVAIFGENPSDWTPTSPRFPRYAQTSAQGEFEIIGLPAGRYHAAVPSGLLAGESGAAVPYADDLAALVPDATTFSLSSGENKTLIVTVE